MLVAQVLNGLTSGTQQVPGNLIVVNDHYGNPIVVVQEMSPGVAVVIQANEPEFNRVIAGLGLNKVVACDKLLINNPVPAGAELVAGPGRELIL